MRNIVVAALGVTALALIGTAPAQAVGIKHAFCIQGGEEYNGLSNCTFDTYAQCLATASGRNLNCIANPYYAGPSDDPYAFQNRNRPFPPTYIPVPPNIYPRY
ncbi:MAG: DUF3551 domain-containing protein [Bradyrhizobium sp.]|nr:DUF3551 domain-containing protein [Bradyrhizobium sp.]